MKLFTKTSLIYILLSVILFTICSIIFYFRMLDIMDEELTEDIYGDQKALDGYISKYHVLPSHIFNPGGIISFDSTGIVTGEQLRDTTVTGDDEEDMMPLRQLIYSRKINDKIVAITISKERFESDDLVEAIAFWMLIIFTGFIIVLFIANYFFSRSVFRTFFRSLREAESYDLNRRIPLKLPKTSTKEFSQLNDSLQRLTDKISADYANLKMFTENASHELQTPLSVIQMQSELLIQEDDLSSETAKKIGVIRHAASRLIKINQALLLLSKLENLQFSQDEDCDVSLLLEEKLRLYDDIIGAKEIHLSKNTAKNVQVRFPIAIADILLTNLIVNAIRYTSEKGRIEIELSSDHFMISNSGEAFNFDKEKLFERFFKGSCSSESNGLGLAIVQKIAETFGHAIDYFYNEGMHVFVYSFRK